MKKTSLFGAVTLVAALTFAQPIVLGAINPTAVYAAETRNAADEAALRGYLADADVTEIALLDNITLTSTLVIDRDVTIVLNDFNITTSTADPAINIIKGNVKITGQGTISNTKTDADAIRVSGSTNSADANYTTVTVDKDVTLESDLYGLFIGAASGKSYGVTINFAGKTDSRAGLYVNGSIQDHTNSPVFNVLDSAVVKGSSMGIAGSGYATWTIGAATIEGKSGIAIKAGIYNLTNTTVTATGDKTVVTLGGNGFNGATGDTFQIENNAAYAGEVAININGGTYTSEKGNIFDTYADETTPVDNLDTIAIEKGVFNAAANGEIFANVAPEEVEITDGSFNQDIIGFIGANTELVEVTDKNGNKTYVIKGGIYVPKPTTVAPNAGALKAETSATALSAVAATATLATIAGAAVIIRRRA